jgi:hypothetical protein
MQTVIRGGSARRICHHSIFCVNATPRDAAQAPCRPSPLAGRRVTVKQEAVQVLQTPEQGKLKCVLADPLICSGNGQGLSPNIITAAFFAVSDLR